MFRYLRWAFLALLALGLVLIASANNQDVTLKLLPDQMSGFLGWSWALTLPLFLVILGSLIGGLLIGFIWEWMREYKHRNEASRQKREAQKLRREVDEIKAETGTGDDVLALLDGKG